MRSGVLRVLVGPEVPFIDCSRRSGHAGSTSFRHKTMRSGIARPRLYEIASFGLIRRHGRSDSASTHSAPDASTSGKASRTSASRSGTKRRTASGGYVVIIAGSTIGISVPGMRRPCLAGEVSMIAGRSLDLSGLDRGVRPPATRRRSPTRSFPHSADRPASLHAVGVGSGMTLKVPRQRPGREPPAGRHRTGARAKHWSGAPLGAGLHGSLPSSTVPP